MDFFSPQLQEDLIRSRVRRPNGPAVNNPTGILTQHAAKQAADRNYTEFAGRSIGLGEKRLKEGSRQFDSRLGLQQDLDQYNRRQGNTAAGISALGLGVSVLDDMSANKRLEEQLKIKNDMIEQLNNAGDANSLFFANLLKYLE